MCGCSIGVSPHHHINSSMSTPAFALTSEQQERAAGLGVDVQWIVDAANETCARYRDEAAAAKARQEAADANAGMPIAVRGADGTPLHCASMLLAEQLFNDLERKFVGLQEQHTLLTQRHAATVNELEDLRMWRCRCATYLSLDHWPLTTVLLSSAEAKQHGASDELSKARDALEKEQSAHANTKAELRRVQDELRGAVDKANALQEELERRQVRYVLSFRDPMPPCSPVLCLSHGGRLSGRRDPTFYARA